MKQHQWYWTPKGWFFAILSVGCLSLGAIVSDKNSTIGYILLFIGLSLLIVGYGRTFLNIRRINKGKANEKT